MKKIAIYGAGGFGKEVVEIIRQINYHTTEWELIGFFDDKLPSGTITDGLPIIGGLKEINAWSHDNLYLILAIANPMSKMNLESNIINPRVNYPVIIHPSVVIPDNVRCSIGKGTVICALNFVSINVTIGKHVLINVSSTIGHDSIIGDYTSIMPSVNISGQVEIGSRVFIGVGAKIINGISISDDVTIGMASAVLRDAPSNTTLMGVPARIIINK